MVFCMAFLQRMGQGTQRVLPDRHHAHARLVCVMKLPWRTCSSFVDSSHNFPNPQPRIPAMTGPRFVCPKVLVFVLPVTLGTECSTQGCVCATRARLLLGFRSQINRAAR
jgi:hypothetical protein